MNVRSHWWVLLSLLFLSSFGALGPAWPAPQKTDRALGKEQDPRIRVEVNLVGLLTSVLDKNGKPVPDLPREAFRVFEEGVEQKVELFEAETSQPLDLALMIDSSLSTLKEIRFEREAAAHFIRQVVRPGDQLAVFQFSEQVTLLSDFSAQVPKLQAAVRSLEQGAGTAMYDAIYLGAQALAKRPRDRRRVIVLVTDAGETTSEADFETARRAALRSEALLYTILVRPVKSEGGRNTAGEHALVTITDATGGAMYSPADVTEFDAVFDRIDRELRTQYRLGYYPSPRPPARSYRRIEVRLDGDYAVRHRKGYFTAGAIE